MSDCGSNLNLVRLEEYPWFELSEFLLISGILSVGMVGWGCFRSLLPNSRWLLRLWKDPSGLRELLFEAMLLLRLECRMPRMPFAFYLKPLPPLLPSSTVSIYYACGLFCSLYVWSTVLFISGCSYNKYCCYSSGELNECASRWTPLVLLAFALDVYYFARIARLLF